MTTINKIRNRIASLDIADEAATAIDQSRNVIINEQKDQLLHGLRADGTKIGKYKNRAYALKKAAMNPLPGVGFMDWKLTGELHSDIFIDVRPETFVIDSVDSKTGGLIDRFGDPFGLTLESRKTVINTRLRLDFVRNIKAKLWGGS